MLEFGIQLCLKNKGSFIGIASSSLAPGTRVAKRAGLYRRFFSPPWSARASGPPEGNSFFFASVMEMADNQDLDSCGETRASSSLAARTNSINLCVEG